MAVWEANIRCEYDYPLTSLSSEIPSIPLYCGCLGKRTWLQIPTSSPAIVHKAVREVTRAGGKIIESSGRDGSHIIVFSEAANFRGGIRQIFDSSQCLLTVPWKYLDGSGYFRVQCLEESRIDWLVRELEGVGESRLDAKRKLPLEVLPSTNWVQTAFANLTAKQAAALVEAYRAGYYREIRRVTRGQIAKSLGIGRTTFEEHLRKAERRVMTALVPILEDSLGTGASTPGRWRGTSSGSRGPAARETR
jgi:predicted DNA binding protein